VGPKLTKALEEAGLTDLAKIASSTMEDLTKIEGVGKVSAKKIIEGAKALLAQPAHTSSRKEKETKKEAKEENKEEKKEEKKEAKETDKKEE